MKGTLGEILLIITLVPVISYAIIQPVSFKAAIVPFDLAEKLYNLPRIVSEKVDGLMNEEGVGEGSDYILSNSNTEYLTYEHLADLTEKELRIARNELYARHGFIFGAEDLKMYFQNQVWYEENSNFSETSLSDIELANVYLISTLENSLKHTSEFIIPYSYNAYLDTSDIANYSQEQLKYIRNEIFARHGYQFASGPLQEYFGSKPWYVANPYFHDQQLSDVELANIEFIQSYE
ncbi:YARHG domain-containing protein [Lysinibacillus sp. FSL H8-0500]|uniref:YARHG domain-containing protein n=1 Tax=Lysinibacillus sp. FSL H8-0500 TaxID=2921393 RepID=UPI003100E74F